ncbi:hypothetical protein VNO80_05888 [Phaseolus coccineus]|uniref:Uncharacterized protein n=1 Tax=Phaseolus coccineus TaxID=3886 RepID=A0AAN9NGR0_PHACN
MVVVVAINCCISKICFLLSPLLLLSSNRLGFGVKKGSEFVHHEGQVEEEAYEEIEEEAPKDETEIQVVR